MLKSPYTITEKQLPQRRASDLRTALSSSFFMLETHELFAVSVNPWVITLIPLLALK